MNLASNSTELRARRIRLHSIINMRWQYGWRNREVYHSLNNTSNWTTWDQKMLRIHGGLTSIFGMNYGILVILGALNKNQQTVCHWIPNRGVRCAYETMLSLSGSEILSSLKLTVEAQENWCLEDYFPLRPAYFQGRTVTFKRVYLQHIAILWRVVLRLAYSELN